MPLFALARFHRADVKPLYEATYDAHMAFVIPQLDQVKLGGPLFDEHGEIVGSLAILEAEDLAAVRVHHFEDPYTKAGIWDRVEINRLEVRKGELASGPEWRPSKPLSAAVLPRT